MRIVVFLLISLCCIQFALTIPDCLAAASCQSCSSTSCTECFTWGKGTYLDKAWNASGGTACDGTMPLNYKVENCLQNYGTSTTMYTGYIIPSTTHPRCTQCDNLLYHYYNDSTLTPEYCSDIAPSAMTTCIAISNCLQTVCVTNKAYLACYACSEGYYPSTQHSSLY